MDRSALCDFHPLSTGLDQPVLALIQELSATPAPPPAACERDAFLALLCGLPALRKTPGLPGMDALGPDYFTTLPRCAGEADAALTRQHLEQVFGITDRDSLIRFCSQELRVQDNWSDFVSFWEGHPVFGLEELQDGARDFFQVARDFSAQFYELVGPRGFLAWDISECLGQLRAAYACGILDRAGFDEMAAYWLDCAGAFQNWREYAVSLVCGGTYWSFRTGSRMDQLQENQDLWLRLVRRLLEDPHAWGSGLWYQG